MSNQIVPFEFGAAQVRSIGSTEFPEFIAADVLAILDLNRSSLAALDDDERGVHTVDTLGGKQSVTTITESGLYSLVMRSRKPEARMFKRWITGEVLPAIRKTGRYEVAQTPEQIMANALIVAQRTLEHKDDVIEHQAAEIAALEPRAAVAAAFEQDHGIKIRAFVQKHFPDEKESAILHFFYFTKEFLIFDPQGRWSDVQQKSIPGPQHQHPRAGGREFFHLAEESDINGKIRKKVRIRRDREHHLVGYLARHGFKTTNSLPALDLEAVVS